MGKGTMGANGVVGANEHSGTLSILDSRAGKAGSALEVGGDRSQPVNLKTPHEHHEITGLEGTPPGPGPSCDLKYCERP